MINFMFSLPHSAPAIVWIWNVTKDPCVDDLVPSLWCYWRWWNLQEVLKPLGGRA
jgi:hypothetical protein